MKKNAQAVNDILEKYEACSGQVINKEKSAILFSKNTNQRQKREMMDIMGITAEGLKGRYLGLPAYCWKIKV